MHQTITAELAITTPTVKRTKHARIESIDLLRGIVMIIMAIDHVRDYFHNEAFVYSPEDLAHTNVVLFFTRWITHYCAPVFVFLAGTSAYLYGTKRSKKQLSVFLLTRGLWLVFVELFILSLFRTFNPAFHFFNLQVIWSTGICMVALSAMIYMNITLLASTGVLLIVTHNLLDSVHVTGNNISSFIWALVHQPGYFHFSHVTIHVHYPVLPWIGVMAVGYFFGRIYSRAYDTAKRKRMLLITGSASVVLFIILRAGNFYGDASHWSVQKNSFFSILSFLNATKYPPSLLYLLMTLGPSFIFLALAEKPLTAIKEKIIVFGRVPMFYYLSHILLIHLFAVVGAVMLGYKWSDMIFTTMVNGAPALKGYGFNLVVVYGVWITLVLLLYPLCKWFARYKAANQGQKWWLSYI
jgi:uncharacterized membrane protein